MKQYMRHGKSKKRIIIPIVIISIVIIIAIVFSTIFAVLNINSNKIVKGVSIKGIDVSGMTQEQAKQTIEQALSSKTEQKLPIKYKDYESTIDPKLIEVNYDIKNAVEEAFKIGRNGNIFSNNYEILNTMLGKKDIDVKMTLNEETAKKSINDIGKNIPDTVKQSSYYIEDNKLVITKGKSGPVVNTDEMLKKLYKVYNDINFNAKYVEMPVVIEEPKPVDVDAIHKEVYKEAKDAYYTKNPFKIYPEVDGVDFDVDKVKELLKENKDEYVIDLKITKPKITISELGTEAFPDRLSTFTTKYDASNKDRTTNLRLATQKINGTVLLPGEEFSYNQVVGERTIAAGYKDAKIYSNGEVVDGLGGGICQISSTLYNTALLANLEITDRRNHQFVTSYVPAGRDATVVYGSQDFKFKNNRTYPIKIKASVSNGIVRISLYGLKEEKEYDISFQTKTVSAIPYKTKYVNDSSLKKGTQKVKQSGANGLVTQTYKIVSYNGKVVEKTLLSKDTYNAMNKIIAKGTR